MCTEFGVPVTKEYLKCDKGCPLKEYGEDGWTIICARELGQVAVMMPTGDNDTFVRQQQLNPS